MEYVLLFVSIFISLTSLIISTFLYVRIEKLCGKNEKSYNLSVKQNVINKKSKETSLLAKQKKNYKEVILRAEKNYFRNTTSFIGLFFLFIGLLFFAGYFFSQVIPLIRFVLLIVLSLIFLIISYILQKKENYNYSIILKTFSSAILLFAAVGSSKFQLLKWTDNQMTLIVLTGLTVLINGVVAFLKSDKNSYRIQIFNILFALSFLNQNNYIFTLSALFSLISVLLLFKRNDLYSVYLISFIYYIYQVYVFIFAGGLSSFSNIIGVFSNIIIIFPLLFYLCKFEIIAVRKFHLIMIYFLNWILFFLSIYHYSVNKYIKETFLIISVLILYYLTKKLLRPVSQYIKNINYFVLIGIFLYALYSLKAFNCTDGLIVCSSIVFLYLFLVIEKNKLVFTLIVLIIISYSLFLVYLILTTSHNIKPEITNYGIIVCISGIAFLIHKSKDQIIENGYNKLLWFITGIIPSLISSALMFATAFSFKNYLLWGLILSLSTIISFGLRNSSLKYGQILSVLLYCVNGYYNYELNQNIIVSFYSFIPFIIVPLLNLLYYSENNNAFCRFVSMFTVFLSIIWVSYKIFFPISAPLPGVLFLLISLISFEVGDLISKIRIKFIFRLKDSLYLWGFLLSYMFIIFHLAVILNSEKYFAFNGFYIQVRLLIEIVAIIVFLFYVLSNRKISNTLISRLNNFNIEILVFLIILTVKSQVLRIYHSPIWVLISFIIMFGVKYLNMNSWRLKIYSVLFCFASMIQTAFYLGTKISVDKSFYKQGWFLGIIAVCFQCVYIIIIRKNKYLDDNSLMSKYLIINKIKEQIKLRYSRYMYYSLFICIAFFINAAFDKSLLSLLWLLESFLIYLIGVFHKDKVLRMISVILIFFCVFRMIMIDLKEENLIVKSAVFLLSGVILLLINIIYKNKISINEN